MSAQYTSPEDNKNVVRRFFQEVLNERNVDLLSAAVDDLVASDHVFRTPDPSEEKRGSNMLTGVVVLLRTISPDLQVVYDDEEIIAEGDIVLSRWKASGNVSDELKRAKATGDEIKGVGAADDKVTVSAISVFRVSGGKITETWQSLEALRDPSEPSPMPPKEVQDVLAKEPLVQGLDANQRGLDWCCKWWPRCCR